MNGFYMKLGSTPLILISKTPILWLLVPRMELLAFGIGRTAAEKPKPLKVAGNEGAVLFCLLLALQNLSSNKESQFGPTHLCSDIKPEICRIVMLLFEIVQNLFFESNSEKVYGL